MSVGRSVRPLARPPDKGNHMLLVVRNVPFTFDASEGQRFVFVKLNLLKAKKAKCQAAFYKNHVQNGYNFSDLRPKQYCVVTGTVKCIVLGV